MAAEGNHRLQGLMSTQLHGNRPLGPWVSKLQEALAGLTVAKWTNMGHLLRIKIGDSRRKLIFRTGKVIFRHAQISAAVGEFHHLLVSQKGRRSELSELSACEGGNFKVTDLAGSDSVLKPSYRM